MATKLTPFGEGMTLHAGGAYGYEPNLPNTTTTREEANAEWCGDEGSADDSEDSTS